MCGREGWLWGSVPSVLGHVLSIHKALSFMASIKTERKWGIREEKGESRDQQSGVSGCWLYGMYLCRKIVNTIMQSSIRSVKRDCAWYWVSGVAFQCSERKGRDGRVFCLVCKAGLLWLSLCSLVERAGERLSGSRTENKESEYV